MKKAILLLVTVILSLFTMPSQAMDLVEDENLIAILTSNEFANELIHYTYEDKDYSIRVIWNPNNAPLWRKYADEPTTLSLIILGNLPISLARRIEDLVLELRGSYEDSFLSLKNGGLGNLWEHAEPVYIAESINDEINNRIISETFNSEKFVNKVIYYYIDQEYYLVRLLHNPEKYTFTETKNYQLSGYGSKDYTLYWSNKYGILFEYYAPKELVDHLSNHLKHISYWDWYFNYTLSNGTSVQFSYTRNYGNHSVTTTWDLDTWFDFTENFQQAG